MTKKLAWSFDRWLFVASCVLFIASCIMLWLAMQPRLSQSFAGIPSSRVVTHGSVTIGISSIRTEKGSGHYAAPAGSHYVVLTLTVTNNIATPITIAPSSDTYMKNDAGDVVYLTPLELNSPFHAGQLLPAETVRGELSYLVRDNQTYRYYLESDWTGGVVSFSLQ
ncbi:MAG: DUF4352 domain-containing protein [Candidatus Saccharimonadales bacterium]